MLPGVDPGLRRDDEFVCEAKCGVCIPRRRESSLLFVAASTKTFSGADAPLLDSRLRGNDGVN